MLSNGFNIVELDTRYLPPNPTILNKLIDMAVTLSDKVRDHVGRLSINMTIPPDMLLEHVQRLCKEIAQPAVLKIDGALDSLSAIQMVRRSRIADIVGNPPIVTCYPLLQNNVGPLFGSRSVYQGARHVWDRHTLSRSPTRYRKNGLDQSKVQASTDRFRPWRDTGGSQKMGIQCFRSLGGSILASCRHFTNCSDPTFPGFLVEVWRFTRTDLGQAPQCACKLQRNRAERGAKAKDDWADNLSRNLVIACDEMFKGRSAIPEEQLTYVSPAKHLSKVNGLHPYRR